AVVVRGHGGALALLLGRLLAKDVEGRAPVALLLVDPRQLLERRRAVLRRTHQVAHPLLGAIQQSGAHVIEAECEGRAFADRRLAVLREFVVYRDGSIHFTALAHQAAERELDLRIVRPGGEPGENLGGAVEAIVDQVIESGEVLDVAAHAPATGRAPAERERSCPDQQETQQQDFGADAAQAHARKLSEKATRSAKITGPITRLDPGPRHDAPL